MSTITLLNETDEVVRLAIFKKPIVNATLATIAWRVAAPPPGGQQVIQIPDSMAVFAQYSSDPANPSNLDVRSNVVQFAEATAMFTIESLESQDRRAVGAQVRQKFDALVLNEVRVVNNFAIGCQVNICQDGSPIYGPQVLWPGGIFLEDVRGSFYIAVISQFAQAGQRLIAEEIAQTQTEVLEGGSLIVRGSMWKGYSLSAT